MIATERKTITVEAKINAPVKKVWEYWTHPIHIIHWNYASEDWQSTIAENDLCVGGKFSCHMEAKDGSFGFDFYGIYTKVDEHKLLEYTLGDDRKVKIIFSSDGNETKVSERFEAEDTNSLELQQTGWQAILNNFKKYVETYGKLELVHFEITINAKVDKVYKMMFDNTSYKVWAAEFNPESHFKGSWEKGSKILFLGTDNDGKMGGMVSKIKENIPNRFVSIEHLGVVMDDQEVMEGPEVDEWAGSLENYTFKEQDGKTLLLIDTDTNHKYVSYLNETWPKALNKLKAICEK